MPLASLASMKLVTFFSFTFIAIAKGDEEDLNSMCPCTYETHPTDEADCRVFGQLDSVVPWHRAMDRCTDSLELDIRPYNTDWLWQTCPNLNGTDANVDAIINIIRDNEDPFGEEIRSRFPDYFVAEGNSTKLVDKIVSGQGVELNCVQTVSFCWSEIKIFFNLNPLQGAAICAELHDKQKATLAEEQSAARVLLCGKEEAMSECEGLHEQILNMKTTTGDCQMFGNEAAASDIPDISTCGKEEEPMTSDTGILIPNLSLCLSILGLIAIFYGQ